MQAIQITDFVKDFSALRPTSHPLPTFPPSPTPTTPHLLILTAHAALNHVDLLYARGKHQNNTTLVRPPFVLGSEFSGIVLSTSWPPSSSTCSFKPGDHVFGGHLGAFATHIVVPESAVRHVPHGWTLREAASLPATLPVSYGALLRAGKLQRGETVLVHAATGGLGVMAVQIARGVGARVLGTVGSEYKRAVAVRELGFKEEEVVLYGVEGWEKRVRGLCEGGVDCVVDSVGLVEGSLRCVKSGGRAVVVGFVGRGGKMEKLQVNRILLKDAAVIGYRFGDRNRRNPGEAEAIWNGCEKLMEQGYIKPILYNERFHGLDAVPRAMRSMEERKVWGKAIIDIAPNKEIEKVRTKI